MFATTVANGVTIETVSKMLGHLSLRTTQIYAKVVERKVSEVMKKLRGDWSNPPDRSGRISNFPLADCLNIIG